MAWGDRRSVPSVGAGEVAALAQRLLEGGEGAGVDGRLVTELAGEGVEVDVVHPGAGVGLGELVGRGASSWAMSCSTPVPSPRPEPLLAAELLRAVPVLARAQPAQQVVEPVELVHQAGGAEGLLRQLGELGPLLGRHRGEHPLGGRGPLRPARRSSSSTDLGVLGEELAVLLHEVPELLGGVVAAGVSGEQVAEVAEHLLDPLAVLGGGVLERLLHAGEALVEQLAAEQVLDLVVLLARLAAAPLVVGAAR